MDPVRHMDSWCVLVKVWLLNTREHQMLMCVIRTDDQGEWRCTSVLVSVSSDSLCKSFESRQTHFNSVLSSIYCHLNRAAHSWALSRLIALSFFLSFFLIACLLCLLACLLSFLSIFLSLRPSIFPSINSSVCLSVHPSIYHRLSVHQFICPSVCLYLSILSSVHASACLLYNSSFCLHLFICLSSTYLFVYLFSFWWSHLP